MYYQSDERQHKPSLVWWVTMRILLLVYISGHLALSGGAIWGSYGNHLEVETCWRRTSLGVDFESL